MIEIKSRNMVLQGIGASPGIAIGKAHLIEEEGGISLTGKYFIEEDQIPSEITRLKNAVQQTKEGLLQIIRDLPEELQDHAYILETHLMLLQDKKLYEQTVKYIEEKQINAEWALKASMDEIRKVFKKMSDPYFRERASDIVQVCDRILKALTGTEAPRISEIEKGVIIVARDLSPAETIQIQLEKVKGFITDLGGKTSHTAIIARSLEIPAVLGLENATSLVRTDDTIIMDGAAGVVIVDPTEDVLTKYQKRKHRYEEYRAMVAQSSHLPAETLDGHRIKVMANIEFVGEVASVIDHGGDGIGLFRTEFHYLNKEELPSEEELFDTYKDIAEIMAPRPVTIRTLDIGGDKFSTGVELSEEINPALGLRAIRFSLSSPEIFKTQLRAILRAANFGNVRVMFPMISEIDEIIKAKQILREVCESLDREGLPFKEDIEVGIMIEVPSAVIMADVIAKEVDFFSIGTNDLIQYSLAIDRVNKDVAHLYQPLHPAVLRMVKHVVDAARNAGIRVGMCGEMAGEPAHVSILLGMGLDELSMNPISIPGVKKMIRMLSVEKSKLFLKEVLNKKRSAEVVRIVEEAYKKLFPDAAYFEHGYNINHER
nr:phosphoenolpyruvate--protein phosphotransferase [Desulfobacterales bacterium]